MALMTETPGVPAVPAVGAGFGIRFAARLIDTVAGFIVGLGVGIAGGILIAVLSTMGYVHSGWVQRVQGFHPSVSWPACWRPCSITSAARVCTGQRWASFAAACECSMTTADHVACRAP